MWCSRACGDRKSVLQERLLSDLKPLHQDDGLPVAIEELRGGERIHELKRRLLSADGSECTC